MKGKEYYYYRKYTGKQNLDGSLEIQTPIKDYQNRVSPFSIEDFEKDDKYFISAFNGSFSRIINMKIIKHMIYQPCPWKDTYKDQFLLLYNDEKAYEEDMKKERGKQYGYFSLVYGYDVWDFLEKFSKVNEELASEISLIIELTKDDGRY